MYYEYTSKTKQVLTSVKTVLTSTILLVIFYTSTSDSYVKMKINKTITIPAGQYSWKKHHLNLLGGKYFFKQIW